MVFYTEIESCTEEMAVVAGGVFGVMGLIVACLVAVLLTRKRYGMVVRASLREVFT